MIIGRALGWIFIIAALAAATYEIVAAIGSGRWSMIALGELWFKVDTASLNAAQAGIQRHVAAWLWDPVIATILLAPGWVVFGIPGLLLLWCCRNRNRRRRFH